MAIRRRRGPPAFAQYPDLSAAAHVGLVDRQPRHWANSEPRRRGPGGLAERGRCRSPDLWRHSRRDRILGRPGRAVRLHLRLLLAFVRWHPSSRLGHRPRFRASVDLHFGMDRRGGEYRTHRGGMDDQPVCHGVAPMSRQSFRSPLARALGLGAAKSGSQHWWAERVTAVALVPLCLWFAASIIAHAGSDYAVFIAWIRTPLATSCMILLLIALF